jgi:Family of unknown function (DUF6235)
MVSYTTVLCNTATAAAAARSPGDKKGAAAMAEPIGPASRRPPTPLRVTSGFDVLEQWSQHATQIEKNIVQRVLFAVVERSVFASYDVVDDVMKTMEFFVLSKCDLTVKIHIHDFDSCGIVYVGPTCAAPGLDQAAPVVAAVPSDGADRYTREDSPHQA